MFRSWDWVDASNVPGPFDWVVSVIGLIGLGVTATQFVRSSNALAAARETYEETRSNLAAAQIIAAVPDLERDAMDLDESLRLLNRKAAEDPLLGVAKRSKELAALLEVISVQTYSATISQLRSTATMVLDARNRLYTADPAEANREVLGSVPLEVNTLVTDLHGVVTSLKNTPTPVKGPKKKGRGQ